MRKTFLELRVSVRIGCQCATRLEELAGVLHTEDMPQVPHLVHPAVHGVLVH